MDDLVIKMESIFGVKQFVSDQPMQYVLSPSDLFNDLINFLPQIMTFFNQLANHLNEVVGKAESEKDAELYTDELNYTKICIGLCLRLFAAFFTWSNFQLEAHKPLLRGMLLWKTRTVLQQFFFFGFFRVTSCTCTSWRTRRGCNDQSIIRTSDRKYHSTLIYDMGSPISCAYATFNTITCRVFDKSQNQWISW